MHAAGGVCPWRRRRRRRTRINLCARKRSPPPPPRPAVIGGGGSRGGTLRARGAVSRAGGRPPTRVTCSVVPWRARRRWEYAAAVERSRAHEAAFSKKAPVVVCASQRTIEPGGNVCSAHHTPWRLRRAFARSPPHTYSIIIVGILQRNRREGQQYVLQRLRVMSWPGRAPQPTATRNSEPRQPPPPPLGRRHFGCQPDDDDTVIVVGTAVAALVDHVCISICHTGECVCIFFVFFFFLFFLPIPV